MGDRDERLSGRGCPPTSRLSSRGCPPTSSMKNQSVKTTLKNKKAEKKVEPVETNVEPEASESEHSEDEEDTADTTRPDTDTEKAPEKKKRRKRKGRFTDYNSIKYKKNKERERERAKEKGKDDPKDGEEMEETEQKDTDDDKKDEEEEAKISFRDYSPFQLLCDNILRKFIAKDQEEYFMFPVSESDAPDYASIITNPMDFSAIRRKISDNEYNHIDEFKRDIDLVAENAMTYNQTNTVYYMAAQKLSTLSKYYFSEQYQTYLRHSLPFGREIPFDMMNLAPKHKESGDKFSTKKPNPARAAIVDNMTPQQILKSANKHVKDKLSTRVPTLNPTVHLGFIDNKDGATVLNIVTSPEKTQLPLGDLLDRLEKGTPGLTTPYEPRLCAQVPISYTNYGPFASFAPQYDSTWATLNKRDSDLLISCYGDKGNATNAIALRQMVEDAEESLIKAVDGILDALTDGEHSRTIKALSNPPEDNEKKETKILNSEEYRSILDEVATLQNVGIDMSFVESLKADLGILSTKAQPYDARIQKTGQMVQDLASMQTIRLSNQPPQTLTDASGPTQMEIQLAGKVMTELQSNIAQCGVKPEDLTTETNIHQAIGLESDDMDILQEFLIV